MALNLTLYVPDQPTFKRKLAYQATPELTVDKAGRFHLKRALLEMLSLRKGYTVQFGNATDSPREWYLTMQPGLGFELEAFHDRRPGLRFTNLALRLAIQASLPYAPADQLLTFKLDTMPVPLADGSEAWALLTAPYWQPQVYSVPVPCRGFQQLWNVPCEVEHQVTYS